jgi:transcriptional regulator with XRE-family HTH domain
MTDKEWFGTFIRRKREEKGIGLREMTRRMTSISPTYLSKIERDEFPPPTEERVREIAAILDCDVDYLLAKAGRVSSDVSDIIKRHPVQLAALVRITNDMSADDINRLANEAAKIKQQSLLERTGCNQAAIQPSGSEA